MPTAKKLQVFVSSTYTDLKAERQAAVEAILRAGHIPAGMELFAAADDSQWNVIKEWIDDSDVFLLILGGRYGSIEAKTGKSYIQLEYEYAVKTGKAYFAVVMGQAYLDERVRKDGREVIEQNDTRKFNEFRATVMSKLCAIWDSLSDLKLAIITTLNDYVKREELVGWYRGPKGNPEELAMAMANLSIENADLRKKLESQQPPRQAFTTGLDFDEYKRLLDAETIDLDNLNSKQQTSVQGLVTLLGDGEPTLFHFFWVMRGVFASGYVPTTHDSFYPYLKRMQTLGLLEIDRTGRISQYVLTQDGLTFKLRAMLQYEDKDYTKHVL